MSEVAAKPDFPPARLLLLIASWALFVLWMLLGSIVGPDGMGVIPPGVRTSVGYRFLLFCLDLWGLGAGLVLGLLGFNPFGWLNGKRLIFGSMAFAMVLGRLGTGWLASYLMFVPVPEVTSFLATPFVLLFGGIGVMLSLFLLALLFGAFFVAVPVMLFNQIFAFEVALAQYRYHARGLGGYIARAVYWLRNEPLPDVPPDEANGARFATPAEINALITPHPRAWPSAIVATRSSSRPTSTSW